MDLVAELSPTDVEIDILEDGSINVTLDGELRFKLLKPQQLVAKMDGSKQATVKRKNDRFWSVSIF